MPAFADHLTDNIREHALTRRTHAAVLIRIADLETQAAAIEQDAARRTEENPPNDHEAKAQYRESLKAHARTRSRLAATLEYLAYITESANEEKEARQLAEQHRTHSREERQSALALAPPT